MFLFGKTVSDEKELFRTSSTNFTNIVSDLQNPNIHEDASDIRSNHDPDPSIVEINPF